MTTSVPRRWSIRIGGALALGALWLLLVLIAFARRTEAAFDTATVPALAVGLIASLPSLVLLVVAVRRTGTGWHPLALALAWGALGAWWFARAGYAIVGLLDTRGASVPGPFGVDLAFLVPATFVAPPVEELVKGVGLFIALGMVQWRGIRPRAVHGAILGAAVGVGFQLAEFVEHVRSDVLFLTVDDATPEVVRSIIAAWTAGTYPLLGFDGHLLLSAAVGIGLAALFGRTWRVAAAWVAVGVLAHTLNNSLGIIVFAGLSGVVSAILGGALIPEDHWAVLLLVGVISAIAGIVSKGWLAWLVVRRVRRPDAVLEDGSHVPDGQ